MHEDDYKTHNKIKDPLSYLSRLYLDTMYFDQAMKQPNRNELLNAAIK